VTADRLTRVSRRAAAARLTALADEIATAASWADALGDADLADRAAQLMLCAERDLLAAEQQPARGDEHLPDGWLRVNGNGSARA
jgi:hypothetical protein